MKKRSSNRRRQIRNLSRNEADIFFTGGTVLNVYSGELINANIAIKGDRIWYVGSLANMVGDNTLVLNVENRNLIPGYIEPHFHPWGIYNPISFGEEACRLGTTTLFCDNLPFYILMGLELFEAFIESLSDMPIKFFWSCRSAPQTPMPGEEELFSIDNVERLLKNPAVQSLGEITRWQEILRESPQIMSLVRTAKRLKKRIDGHTAGAKYDNLNVLCRAGVESCHESISGEEVLDRLRLGLYVMLRQSSLRQDLSKLLRTVMKTRVLKDRLMLTTDGSTPAFYQKFGITDNLIRIAIKAGMDPITAYRMSTINPAVYFGLDHEIGGIAPGRYADILVLEDLLNPTPEMVISKGRMVGENGLLREPFPRMNWERFFPRASFSKGTWHAKSQFFEISCQGKTVVFPTIKLVSPVITRNEWVEFGVEDGFVNLRKTEGFVFLALLNRDGKWVANGILQGFGDQIEGLASSYNTAMEILVIGSKPAAMSAAVNRLLEMKGGIIAVENGKIAFELPLPVGGIMSDDPMQKVAEEESSFRGFLSKRGYPFHDPLYTLVFLPNDFLPDVRINYNGVIDIKKDEILWPRRELM